MSNDLEVARSYIKEWLNKVRSESRFDANDWMNFEKETDIAKKIIDNVLKEDPNNQEAKIELARWHLCRSASEGRLKGGENKAIKHMLKVVEIMPDSANYRCGLGLLYSRAGKKKLAIEQLEKAIELEPDNLDFKKELENVKAEGGCFIATAVYESPFSFEVEILRKYRDENLLTSFYGRLFVKLYYYLSPPVADFISDKQGIKYILKNIFLNPFVQYLKNKGFK